MHDALVEGIVVADDDLMERYLEGEIPERQAARGDPGPRAWPQGQVFPVVCGSATKEIAVDRLATFICEIGPSPLDRPPVRSTAGERHRARSRPIPTGPPLAWVWKTVADRHVGKISLFKVLSGRIRPDDTLVNARTHTDERVHAPFTLRGKEQLTVDELPVGDIGAVAKLPDVVTGDTLAPKGTPVVDAAPTRARTGPAVGIRPRSKGDEDKLMTGPAPAAGGGSRPLGARATTRPIRPCSAAWARPTWPSSPSAWLASSAWRWRPSRSWCPTGRPITGKAEAEGKYKKQTGGHGQFGVAFIRIEPLERGEGFEFVDQIVGGAIPRQFIPAVQKGIEEAMANGGSPRLAGRRRAGDAASTASIHSVDSSEMSFKMAGALAFREAMEKAGAGLARARSPGSRSPCPTAYQGDVMGDLNSRRGRVQGTEVGADGDSIDHRSRPHLRDPALRHRSPLA